MRISVSGTGSDRVPGIKSPDNAIARRSCKSADTQGLECTLCAGTLGVDGDIVLDETETEEDSNCDAD